MATSKRILLVEDDPKSLFALQSVLEARGYEIQAYPSAEKAAECDGHPFDAAIIDVRLPEQQGDEFARQIKIKDPRARIILVTAFNSLPHIKKTMPEAAVLTKPFDIESLVKLL